MRPWLLLLVVIQTVSAMAQPNPRSAATNVARNLPVLAIDTHDPIASDTRVPCKVRLLLPNVPPATNVLTGAVRIHGASSQGYPKKSLGITLDAPVNWLGLHESAHWVVNAAFVDRSLMRHKLSYDLFRSLSGSQGPRFASGSRFIEVILNGHYEGAYLLMERVDRALLGLHSFDTNSPQHACIYKAVDHSANFDNTGHWGYEQREPDPLLHPYWTPLDQFNRFVSSASETQFFNPTNGISTRLDLGNVIDFHLLLLLTSNMDGFDKNLILARNAPLTNAPTPRFFFVPWDYDATFGRNWEGSRVGATHWLSNNLFERLLNHPDYRRRFGARWKEVRAREFSVPAICALIDENAATLGDAVQRNAHRWREADGNYPDRLTFKQDIEEMKKWVERRTQWLDQQIMRRTGG